LRHCGVLFGDFGEGEVAVVDCGGLVVHFWLLPRAGVFLATTNVSDTVTVVNTRPEGVQHAIYRSSTR
jgi:hypothetical protein